MLISPAEKAGMKVPPDVNDFEGGEYPHFAVYCNIQLGSPMPHPTAHWDNAEVIAAVSDDKIKSVTFNDLVAAGLAMGFPWP